MFCVVTSRIPRFFAAGYTPKKARKFVKNDALSMCTYVTPHTGGCTCGGAGEEKFFFEVIVGSTPRGNIFRLQQDTKNNWGARFSVGRC